MQAFPIPRSRRVSPTVAVQRLQARPPILASSSRDETEKWGKVVKFAGIKPQ